MSEYPNGENCAIIPPFPANDDEIHNNSQPVAAVAVEPAVICSFAGLLLRRFVFLIVEASAKRE